CELVERRPSGTTGSRSVYALTPKGVALLPVLDDLTAWSEQWVPRTELARHLAAQKEEKQT
ncbi:MAG: winged helix-turn-helix transcriptional regulator, partial [Cellulomonadaceae bacterium]